ncbi:MAG: baseplate J/gp47 family protein [Chloroflexi bacterium]|nr:baseplate J/gp47 family protein [Chloroflexota bacterium]
MTEILPIDPDATIEGVRRQLAQVRTDHVALALPVGWTELDNVARMRLLQRQAQIQRCHLGLITRDETTRKAADQLGIPVFFHTSDVNRRTWRMHPPLPLIHSRNPAAALPEPPTWRPRRGRAETIVDQMAQPTAHLIRQRRIRSEASRQAALPTWLRLVGVIAVLSLTVLFLAMFAFYVLPAATITLAPGREPVTVTVPLTANPNLSEPDLDNNQLPARLIQTSIEQVGKMPTTGRQQKAVDKAQGTVVFSNLGGTQVFIPAGSTVSTSTGTPILFRTTADTGLEARVGARASAPIEAVEPGIEGNVRANTINTVEGALRYRIGVSNPDATVSGGSEQVLVVTQADRDNLLEQLKKEVATKAYGILKGELKAGEWLPEESLQTFVDSSNYSQFNDEQASELTLTLRSLVRGVAVDEASTRRVLFASTQRQIPQQGKLVADSLTTLRAPGITIDGDNVEFTVTVKAQYVVPIDPADVRKLAVGGTPKTVIEALQKRWPLERVPEIYQDPAWLKTLPILNNRIQVRIEYADDVKK